MIQIDWWQLLAHFVSLSLLAIGGAISTAPEMYRYLVDQQRWLSHAQFTSSFAIAQAAPGPNVIFIALLGWQLGINSIGAGAAHDWVWALWGLWGALVAMLGTLIPSTTLTFMTARWCHKNRELLAVRAFKAGMAPIVVALITSAGWLLASTPGENTQAWRLWLVSAVATLVVWRTRIHILWLLGAGAILGWFGWI